MTAELVIMAIASIGIGEIQARHVPPFCPDESCARHLYTNSSLTRVPPRGGEGQGARALVKAPAIIPITHFNHYVRRSPPGTRHLQIEGHGFGRADDGGIRDVEPSTVTLASGMDNDVPGRGGPEIPHFEPKPLIRTDRVQRDASEIYDGSFLIGLKGSRYFRVPVTDHVTQPNHHGTEKSRDGTRGHVPIESERLTHATDEGRNGLHMLIPMLSGTLIGGLTMAAVLSVSRSFRIKAFLAAGVVVALLIALIFMTC